MDNNSKKKNNKMVLTIQEAERQRIARDLHDTSLQNLTHIVHQLELFGLYMEKDPLRANIELLSIKKGLKSVIDEIRDIIFDLRPMTFDDLGLKETFETFFENLRNTTNFEYILRIESIESKDQILLLNIYRIVVECIYNSIRHSQGTKIGFMCSMDNNRCNLCIEDNGIGFTKKDVDNKKNHFGLSVMYERVQMLDGELTFETEPGNGTKIFISIPL
ncbi:MAG: sensor histidine kinase [Lachnospiraceae bacterium]|nr:sensor histidine kinase [Lachnospiraceae bacterium]